MALDAVYIRNRSLSPKDSGSQDAGWQRSLRSEADSDVPNPVLTQSLLPHSLSRPGLGSISTSTNPQWDDDDHDRWHSLRTGEPLAIKALRMRDRFVKATSLSDPTLRTKDEAVASHDSMSHQLSEGSTGDSKLPSVAPNEKSDSSTITLAQLYSQLTQDMPSTVHPSSIDPGPSTEGLRGPKRDRNKRDQEDEHHHSHHHRHQPDARHRSEWFISRALTKMRRSGLASSSKASISALSTSKLDSSSSGAVGQSLKATRTGRCPRCGDALPADATPEYMARHRQSIGHRLGLNAPVSSASASEAPSPDSSQPPTPAVRSRSSSPLPASSPNAEVQRVQRQSGKLPHRLSQASRWKKISRDNVGHSLLSRMGWKEGMGLGVHEWKWQQAGREKLKKQQSDAVRALLLRRDLDRHAESQATASATNIADGNTQQLETQDAFGTDTSVAQEEPEWLQFLLQQQTATDPSASSSLETTFPFELDIQTQEQQLEAAQMWLSRQNELDAEWFQSLTQEQDALQQALLSGEITLQDIQTALWSDHEAQSPHNIRNHPSTSASTSEVIAMAADDDLMQSKALLYPVEVELRTGRSGIGVKRFLSDKTPTDGQRRRSRTAEGSIEIRKQSSSLTDSPQLGQKKLRSNPTSRPFKSSSRSRSRSSTRGNTHAEQHTDLTRRQRELAYQREKRDWLDLRASLS